MGLKVAAIGDSVFVRAFELIGAEGFEARDAEEVKRRIKEVVEGGRHSIIIIPERYVDETREVRMRIMRESGGKLMFAFVPDHLGGAGKRVEELKRLLSLAVGVKLRI